MTDVTIRAASPGDCKALARLNDEVQRLHVARRPDDFKPVSCDALEAHFAELLADRSATVWLAELDGAAAGFLVVRVRDKPENLFCKARTWWELDAVGVAASFRRQGVCRALFEHVMADARAQGVAELELQTWGFNAEAQAAFRRLGFVPKSARYELRLEPGCARLP
jgi:ribosomal protein S18 acetylase RimI-like enzyme